MIQPDVDAGGVEGACHLRADALGRTRDERRLAGNLQGDAHTAAVIVLVRFMRANSINPCYHTGKPEIQTKYRRIVQTEGNCSQRANLCEFMRSLDPELGKHLAARLNMACLPIGLRDCGQPADFFPSVNHLASCGTSVVLRAVGEHFTSRLAGYGKYLPRNHRCASVRQ